MDTSALYARNDALNINPDIGGRADISITTHGSDFYYAICTIMGLASLTVLGLSFMKPRTDRIFFYITAAINATACIAYFSMGSNLGQVPITAEFQRNNPLVRGVTREIFYARYIDWFVTTPLLLMDLLLTAGMPWPSILWTIFLDEVMIVTGLLGALTRTRYKFGFYAFGCIAMFAVFYELAVNGRSRARALGDDVHRVFLMCGVLTLVVWLCYPIAWGVSEGGNVIAPDSEAVFYGVLDFLAKPCFSAALIYGHWGINPARLGLRIRTNEEMRDISNAAGEKRNGVAHGQNNDHRAPPYEGETTGMATSHDHATGTATSHDHASGSAPAHDFATSGRTV